MGCKRNAIPGGATDLFRVEKRIILASGSPRRKDFFRDLGFEFEVITADVDETPHPGEQPEAFCCRMALNKAGAVAVLHPEAWVVGADTIVVIGERILGKPLDEDGALVMLGELNGNKHSVLTGYALVCVREKVRISRSVATDVYFHRFPEEVLEGYVRTGEPMDKAGSYGIQGIGSFLVDRIQGSCTNVIGLPVSELIDDMLRLGIIRPGG